MPTGRLDLLLQRADRRERAAWSAWLPWLKFSRKTSAPARTARSIISWVEQAGPSVATIFALRLRRMGKASPGALARHRAEGDAPNRPWRVRCHDAFARSVAYVAAAGPHCWGPSHSDRGCAVLPTLVGGVIALIVAITFLAIIVAIPVGRALDRGPGRHRADGGERDRGGPRRRGPVRRRARRRSAATSARSLSTNQRAVRSSRASSPLRPTSWAPSGRPFPPAAAAGSPPACRKGSRSCRTPGCR